MLQYFWNKWWEKDPDFFRIKHATRTVVAVIIATLLFHRSNIIAQVYAGIAAGFSIQGIMGERWQEKLILLVCADICYYLAITLGSLVNQNIYLEGITLTLLAFFALYVRRFGDRFTIFPIQIWVFCFFGVIFPVTSMHFFFRNSIALVVGFIVALFCYFVLFPENQFKSFHKNLSKFFSSYALSLQWLKNSLQVKIDFKEFSRQIEKYKWHDLNLMRANQTILETFTNTEHPKTKYLTNLYIIQFSIMKALTMIIESFERMSRENINLSETALKKLNELFEQFIILLSCIQDKTFIDNANNELQSFREYLSTCELTNNTKIVILLNIHLGFQLLLKNLLLWEKNK